MVVRKFLSLFFCAFGWPRLNLFFKPKDFFFQFNIVFYRQDARQNRHYFSLLFWYSYFVTLNLVVIFNNNGIGYTRSMCELIMLSTVWYSIGYLNMVGCLVFPCPYYMSLYRVYLHILLYPSLGPPMCGQVPTPELMASLCTSKCMLFVILSNISSECQQRPWWGLMHPQSSVAKFLATLVY